MPRSHALSICITALLLASLTHPLVAQSTLGIDGGASIETGTPSTLTIDLPLQQLRVGFALSNRVTIEPFGAFSYVKQSGGDGFTSISAGSGLVYRFNPGSTETSPYLRPFAAVESITGAGSTDARLRLGAGIGVERRITRVIALRAEAGVSHRGATGITPASTSFDILAGLTVATR